MRSSIHPKLDPAMEVSGLLLDAVSALAESMRRHWKEHHRKRYGSTLRPGPDTPLWNQLSRLVRARLRKRGDKVNLGRLLGVPRQTIHRYFVSCDASPDAERTLLLLWWIRHDTEKAQPRPKHRRIPRKASD